MLNLAADAVVELSKENPSGEIVEYKTKDFLRTLEVRSHASKQLEVIRQRECVNPSWFVVGNLVTADPCIYYSI